MAVTPYQEKKYVQSDAVTQAQQALQKARTLSPKNPNYYPDGVTPYGRRSY